MCIEAVLTQLFLKQKGGYHPEKNGNQTTNFNYRYVIKAISRLFHTGNTLKVS